MKVSIKLAMGFMILGFATTLSVPLTRNANLQISKDLMKTKVNLKAMQWGKFGFPASEKNLKGTPNPGGIHIEVLENGDLIVVHPLPKPTVSESNVEANFVQWAVDNVNPGGTVRLDTRDITGVCRIFDFNGHTVTVLNEVHIEGIKESSVMADDWTPDLTIDGLPVNQNFDDIIETGEKRTIKSDRAVIYNGTLVIGSQDIIIFPDGSYRVIVSEPQNASIKSLRFERSPIGSVVTYSAISSHISDNVITNVVPGKHWFHPYYEAAGIVVVGYYSGQRSATIENNFVDLFGDDSAEDPILDWTGDSRADGIAIYGMSPEAGIEKQAIIINNTVKNCGGVGIYITHLVGAQTLVSGNYIKQRKFPNLGEAAWGGGIDLINVEHILEDPPVFATARIENNTMEDISATGIFMIGQENSHILENHIQKTLLDSKPYKISIWGPSILNGISIHASRGCILEANTIKGEGAFGISVMGYFDSFTEQFVESLYNTINIGMHELENFTSVALDSPPFPLEIPTAHVMFGPEGVYDNTVFYPDNLTVIDIQGTNFLLPYKYID